MNEYFYEDYEENVNEELMILTQIQINVPL